MLNHLHLYLHQSRYQTRFLSNQEESAILRSLQEYIQDLQPDTGLIKEFSCIYTWRLVTLSNDIRKSEEVISQAPDKP